MASGCGACHGRAAAGVLSTLLSSEQCNSVIAGDFDTDRVLDEVCRTSSARFRQVRRRPRWHCTNRRSAANGDWSSGGDPKVPRLAIAYHAPADRASGQLCTAGLGVILAEGKASRLYQRMVEREQSRDVCFGGISANRRTPRCFIFAPRRAANIRLRKSKPAFTTN